jgi:hypothetical protein
VILCLRLNATLIRSSLFRPAFWSSPSQPPSALSSSRYLHAHQAGSGSLATLKSTDRVGSAAEDSVPNDVFSENTDQAGAGPNAAPRLLLLLLCAHGTQTTPTFRWPDPGRPGWRGPQTRPPPRPSPAPPGRFAPGAHRAGPCSQQLGLLGHTTAPLQHGRPRPTLRRARGQ